MTWPWGCGPAAGPDVICVAKNDAVLDGLLTVFHAERSSAGLSNVQNELPVLSEYDKDCLQVRHSMPRHTTPRHAAPCHATLRQRASKAQRMRAP